MARKKDSPQKAALWEMMSCYLKENDVKVKDGTDVNSIMRDMMSIILEGVLDQEMDEELGYSKYDYRNMYTDNSRNGHSQKTMHTSYGGMEIDIPRDRKGVLGMYVGQNESAKFWLSILNGLKNSGVEDILIACPLSKSIYDAPSLADFSNI